MNLLTLFRRRNSAPVARERLQVLLAHERAFVLAPWLDADPGAVLPGHGPVAALLLSLREGGVRRRADLALRQPA